jgi:hypothetical protein
MGSVVFSGHYASESASCGGLKGFDAAHGKWYPRPHSGSRSVSVDIGGAALVTTSEPGRSNEQALSAD